MSPAIFLSKFCKELEGPLFLLLVLQLLPFSGSLPPREKYVKRNFLIFQCRKCISFLFLFELLVFILDKIKLYSHIYVSRSESYLASKYILYIESTNTP